MSTLDEYNLNLPKARIMARSARFSKRAVSFIIDIFVVYFFILFPLAKFIPSSYSFSSALSIVQSLDSGLVSIIVATASLVYLLYFSCSQYFVGKTIGMWVFGLQTIPMTFYQAVLRNAFLIFIFPFSLLAIIDLIYLLRFKQRLLEKLTMTATLELQIY